MKAISRSINFWSCRNCLSNSHSRANLRFISECSNSNRAAAVDEATVKRRRVVTGLQPTGALHVGNYFAAVKRCVELQRRGDDLMIFIADLHALTAPQDGATLRRRTLELAATLVAAGVDPERAVLWQQSAVPRHAELCWLLVCLASLARLRHLPQYKEKTADEESAGEMGAGVLLYPVLQAADVLLYSTSEAGEGVREVAVPVGADQVQHVQLAAQLARTANHRLRTRLFRAPVALLPEDGSERIRSLRDPGRKMSKSDADPKSRILLSDSDHLIRLKIRKAVTDFTPQVSYSPEQRPGVSNLVRLHCLAADLLPEEAVVAADSLTTAQYKEVVSDAVCAAVSPLRARAADLLAHETALVDILREGAARARARADVTWERVAAAAGLSASRDVTDVLRVVGSSAVR